MPPIFGRSKKRSTNKDDDKGGDKPATAPRSRKKDPKPQPIAHIVKKGSVAAAKRGEEVLGLCGEKIAGEPKGEETPVCRKCFILQLTTDDGRTDQEKKSEYERGQVTGRSNAEATQQREREEAERRRRRELEAPRFEDLGDSVRLKPFHGGEATVRKAAVGSITVQPREGGQHAVVVDGLVLHQGSDEALAKKHYDDLHRAVFQPLARAS